MSIHSISPQSPSLSGKASGLKEDPQIKTLEQKLLQLNKEKEKAEKAKDADKVRELEQKIKEIERRLDELKSREAKKKDEIPKEDSSDKPSVTQSDVGNYVDEYA